MSKEELEYNTYLIKMLCLDIDSFIDAEHLSFEEFCKRKTQTK